MIDSTDGEPLCEATFQRLAKDNPRRLVELMVDLEPAHLTFAAEALKDAPSGVAIPALFRLRDHPRAHVREGTVYGLGGHLNEDEARRILQIMAEHDPSKGVREAAREELEED